MTRAAAAALVGIVAASFLSAAATAQHPSPQRVAELINDFPELQNTPNPVRGGYILDPTFRRKVAPPKLEDAYTKALEALAGAELSRAVADDAVISAVRREESRQADVSTAENNVIAAEEQKQRAQRMEPPDGGGSAIDEAEKALAYAKSALFTAKVNLVVAQSERKDAEQKDQSVDVDFQKIAALELAARAARNNSIVPANLLQACSVQGMAIQRNTIIVQFADSATKPEIDAVLQRHRVHTVSGMPEISLFILEMDPPLHLPESDREHQQRLTRTTRGLAAEKQFVVTAVQQGTLHGATTPRLLPAVLIPRPCWSWPTANDSGIDSAKLIRLPLAWGDVNTSRKANSAAIPVAVLDEGFSANDDLTALTNICSQTTLVHGSQVAGVLTGASGNDKVPQGTAPIAQVTTCALGALPADCVGDNVAFISVAVSLRDLIVNHTPKVINVSLGYNWSDFSTLGSTDADVQTLVTAQGSIVRDLLTYFQNTVVVVSAAGNDCFVSSCDEPAVWTSPINWAALGPTSPSGTPACANVLVVEDVDSKGTEAVRSCKHGSVRAPGEQLLTCGAGTDSSPDGGTSIAAPVVSAVAALMLARNSALKPEQIVSIIKQSNIVDALSAVQTAATTH